MKWVTVDFGASTVKASVLDRRNHPVRLSYSMGDYETTSLSSVAVVTDDKNVVIGDYALLLGIDNPGIQQIDWLKSADKAIIAKAFCDAIYKAAMNHYADTDIGMVILFTETLDSELERIAKIVFREVSSMQVGSVIKSIISPQSDLMLIADFGERAFRVIMQDKYRTVFQLSNESLGFSAVEVLPPTGFEESAFDSMQIALMGRIIQHVKILANNGERVILPDNLSVDVNTFMESFEQKITTYFYQCFEECTNALKSLSKSWTDIGEVVFIGGGACCSILDSVFEKYMQIYCPLVSYNRKNRDFDPQYAASRCAIQMPLWATEEFAIKY